MNPKDIDLRDYIGKMCWSIRPGKYNGVVSLNMYEIMEAPGQHKYINPRGLWMVGKLINEHTNMPGQRPIYIDIPWKWIVYPTSPECFFMTKDAAIDSLEKVYADTLETLRQKRFSLMV